MNCPKCGANIQSNDGFCAKCGQDLKQAKAQHDATHRKMPGWIKLLALVAILIALGIAFFIYQVNGFPNFSDFYKQPIDIKLTEAETSNAIIAKEESLPAKKHEISAKAEDLYAPIEEQLKELKAGHLFKAFHELVSKDFAAETSFDQFRKYIETYPILANYSKYSFKDHSINNEFANVTVILNPEKEAVPLEYKLIYEEGKWKIWSIRIVLPPAETQAADTADDPLSLIDPVRAHIQALEKNDPKKAYEDPIADEFREATSLEDFEKFLKKYPVFTHHKTVSLLKPTIEQGVGKIQVEFTDDKGSTVSEYALTKQGNAWKIVGIRLLQIPGSPPAQTEKEEKSSDAKPAYEPFDSKPLLEVIQNQLDALKNNNVAKAYNDYTSKEFREATSLKQFENFVNAYDVFKKDTKASFDKLMFNNNIGTYSGTFTDQNNRVFGFEYDMMQENGKWKILHIQLTPLKSDAVPAKPDPAKPLRFSKIVMGTEIDLKGFVGNPATTFQHDAGDIYTNIYIENGAVGTKIEVTFKHLDSGSSIPPISTTLPDNGSSTASFVFSPPTKGWPKGKYQLDIKASSGESTTYDFTVE